MHRVISCWRVEGDEGDWLMSDDGGCLLAAYKQLEIIDISYDASTEENLLNSYRQSYSDASMIDFQKYYVNGFPVIRYIVAYTADGLYQYQGELIVFPSDILNCSVSAQIICEDAGEENAAHASIGTVTDEEAYSVKISNCSYTNADREVDDWNRFSADGNN